MKVKAYAKINLRLKVLGLNKEGYHLLQMVNTKIGLFDVITIKKLTNKEIVVDMDFVPRDDNLVYKVVKKMFEEFNLPGGIYIKIKKNIPLGAGLGGGSSDAAMVILAVNKLYKLSLDKKTLQELSLLFGTDIVYCLEEGLALVEGIGEKITKLNRKIKSWVLIINPNIELSTKDIYTKYDLDNKYSIKNELCEIEEMKLDALLENDLEKVVFKEYPLVSSLKEELINSGNPLTLMSGSGSTIFVLNSPNKIRKLYKQYKSKYPNYKIYITKIK
ncbi:MAG: 4-(cytidine 5'-diphospho)-2-C-methyl-D-erythritol kinase [Bacilli bacterium]|nr:4-(cytidine 5'-diphospho)-2-C-methyl-D-erythritol kinase [Bacilli bacterium]